jgi:tetratricopeptide (TPR) repeat protein
VLVSWKEIAVFLDRAERTVKRWERERGLPVHRVPGGERSGVFAYSDELTAWLHGEESRADETIPAVEDQQHKENPSIALLANLEPAPEVPREINSSKLDSESADHRSNSALWRAVVWTCILSLVPASATFITLKRYRSASPPSASSVQPAPPGSRHIPSPRAEQLYLQGRYQWSLRTAESLGQSVDAYTQAIVEDPAYAQAYAGLAESYDLLPQYSRVNSADSFQRAKAAASRAIELDPNLAAGHRAKAFALFYGYWDVAGSDAEFKRALALAENEAETHHWYGTTLFSRQEDTRSLAQLDEAVRLSPTTPAIVADAAFVHASLRNNREANIKILRELSRTQPTLVKSSRYLAGIDLADGNYHAYLADIRKVAEITHDPVANALATAASRGWARGGRSGLLQAILKAAQTAFSQGADTGVAVGEAYMRLEQPEQALPYFRAAFERNDPVLMRLSACECPAAVKNDPEYISLFQEVRKRMGLPNTQEARAATSVKPGSADPSTQ